MLDERGDFLQVGGVLGHLSCLVWFPHPLISHAFSAPKTRGDGRISVRLREEAETTWARGRASPALGFRRNDHGTVPLTLITVWLISEVNRGEREAENHGVG